MSVVALTSASGSPGVTSTALGLALAWPRSALLVEADPTGGSALLAGYFRGSREYDGGLVELALSSAGVRESLPVVARCIPGSQATFIAGTRSHAQATGLRSIWGQLADALAELDDHGQDVIVDAGRLGLVGSPEPILAGADLTLVVTRSTLPALAAARSWTDPTSQLASGWRSSAILLIGEGQPYSQREVSMVLGMDVMASIADDAACAAVYSRGATPPKNASSSAHARSLRTAVQRIQGQVGRPRSPLMEATR